MLDHPNIVKLYYNFENINYHYFILELGKISIKNFIDKIIKNNVNGFNTGTAVSFIKQMIKSIKYLHDKNIIHYDIKLENFVLFEDGTIKLIDFGFSIDSKNSSNKQGTLKYMAPEIKNYLDNKEVKICATNKIDIYSLGISIYYMINFKFPDLNNKLVFDNKLNNKKLDKLNNLIIKMLELEPEKRIDIYEVEKLIYQI